MTKYLSGAVQELGLEEGGMLESLPPLGVLTPSALLGLTVYLILRGHLIPRKSFDDQVERADQWMAESRIKDQQIQELVEQNTALLREFGPTALAVLNALRGAAGGQDDGDGTAT